ncbi:MAG: NYN domain-containing protein [Magnetococcales bacterium]|nr:NYN domain-containing protein [Magnetococcales bacterium]
MYRVAVFVDAGYFWSQLSLLLTGAKGGRDAIRVDFLELRGVLMEEFQAQFPGAELLRVYWYDGPSADGSKGPDHEEVDGLDDFKLRLGMRNGLGQQKAVDGLVIADMVTLAQSRAISSALLVSGDADIAPGVMAAQTLGLRVHLLSIGPITATSPHLAAEVDRKTAWPLDTIARFASRAPGATEDVAVPVSAPPPAKAVPSDPDADPSATPAGANLPVVTGPGANTGGQVLGVDGTFPTVGQSDSDIDWSAVARKAYDTILTGPYASLLVALPPTATRLPPELDRSLLAAGRKRAHRFELTEPERHALRTAFKRLLDRRPS